MSECSQRTFLAWLHICANTNTIYLDDHFTVTHTHSSTHSHNFHINTHKKGCVGKSQHICTTLGPTMHDQILIHQQPDYCLQTSFEVYRMGQVDLNLCELFIFKRKQLENCFSSNKRSQISWCPRTQVYILYSVTSCKMLPALTDCFLVTLQYFMVF